MKSNTVTVGAALSLVIASCTQSANEPKASLVGEVRECGEEMIGRFDPSKDLLVANFDSKPDVDDLQAVAALGTVLKHPSYSCIDFIATHGAYGKQTGTFLPAANLFSLAFGEKWLDAHEDREGTIAQIAQKMRIAIEASGTVWVAEAGQSDLTAEAVKLLPKEMWGKINVVQHSYWNEIHTSTDAMNLLVYNVTYHRIQDGNFANNGTPAFNTNDGSYWAALLGNSEVGPIWKEAKQLSELHNPVAEYVNPAVQAGGLDFSDTVEVAYILGFEDMNGVGDFVERFSAAE